MSEDTLETPFSLHSHGVDENREGGRIKVNPPDSQTTLDKFYVAISGSRDLGSEVPKTVSGKMKGNLASVATRRDGKKTVVAADVHCSGDGNVSVEDDVEPDPPDSDSSDGRTLWYLTSDIKKGTRATHVTKTCNGHTAS